MPDVTPAEAEPPAKAQAAAKIKAKSPITWGPVAAVVVSVGVYLLSQLLGSVVITIYVGLRHMNTTVADEWANGVWPQFFYVVLVESITLWLLHLFLKHRKATFKTLGMIKPRLTDLGWSFIGFGIYFPTLIVATMAVTHWLPDVSQTQKQQLGFTNAHGPELFIVFLSLVVIPPFVEEILARGFLYLGLKKKLHWFWAALITSAMFATAHLQLGSGAPPLWSAAIDTFILSCVLIWLRERTGGLWASIGLHMIKNALAFVSLFLLVK